MLLRHAVHPQFSFPNYSWSPRIQEDVCFTRSVDTGSSRVYNSVMRWETFGIVTVAAVLGAWLILVVMVAPTPHEPARPEPTILYYGPWEQPSPHAYQVRTP